MKTTINYIFAALMFLVMGVVANAENKPVLITNVDELGQAVVSGSIQMMYGRDVILKGTVTNIEKSATNSSAFAVVCFIAQNGVQIKAEIVSFPQAPTRMFAVIPQMKENSRLVGKVEGNTLYLKSVTTRKLPTGTLFKTETPWDDVLKAGDFIEVDGKIQDAAFKVLRISNCSCPTFTKK
jgi:hypothetical protein